MLKVQNFLPEKKLIQICYTLVYPLLICCFTVLDGSYESVLKTIRFLQIDSFVLLTVSIIWPQLKLVFNAWIYWNLVLFIGTWLLCRYLIYLNLCAATSLTFWVATANWSVYKRINSKSWFRMLRLRIPNTW